DMTHVCSHIYNPVCHCRGTQPVLPRSRVHRIVGTCTWHVQNPSHAMRFVGATVEGVEPPVPSRDTMADEILATGFDYKYVPPYRTWLPVAVITMWKRISRWKYAPRMMHRGELPPATPVFGIHCVGPSVLLRR